MRKTLLCLLMVATIMLMPLSALADETRGFETPEACAQAVFDALKEQDMVALDSCFAFAELARQFDFKAFCERLNAVIAYNSLLPATSPLNIAYNESKLRRDFLFRLSFTTLALNQPQLIQTIGQGLAIAETDEAYVKVIRQMTEGSTMDCWGTLTLVDIVTPEYFPELAHKFYSDVNQRNIEKALLPWGVSEYAELILILGLPAPGEVSRSGLLMLPLQIDKVDGRWLANPNSSNVANLLGISAMNMVASMAE